MYLLTEKKFAEICRGIFEDRETIIKHNPLGAREEILLWMLLSVLNSLLSLSEQETPCFTGIPTAETYRQAIDFIVANKSGEIFETEKYISEMLL